MNLNYAKWMKDIEALTKKFNDPKTNPLERLAVLIALRERFRRETQGLESHIPRYEERAMEAISG